MPEIRKCCDEDPEITDHQYDFSEIGDFIPLWRYTFRCKRCGHHIHSDKKQSLFSSIEIWNRSKHTINYVPARQAKFK